MAFSGLPFWFIVAVVTGHGESDFCQIYPSYPVLRPRVTTIVAVAVHRVAAIMPGMPGATDLLIVNVCHRCQIAPPMAHVNEPRPECLNGRFRHSGQKVRCPGLGQTARSAPA